MGLIQSIISFIIHIDQHLLEIIDIFGVWAYVILFLIVFIETGFVIFPFLPGDSLLFASGTFAALGSFNIITLIIVFLAAAIIGDTVNYHIGKTVGNSMQNYRWFSRVIDHKKLAAAEAFFNKHGGQTIIIARFMPFVRTFAPFVAGASRMNYGYFITYNIIGAVLWVFICTLAGYLFGNIPIIRDNFTVVIFAIIFISVLPPVITFIKGKLKKK